MRIRSRTLAGVAFAATLLLAAAGLPAETRHQNQDVEPGQSPRATLPHVHQPLAAQTDPNTPTATSLADAAAKVALTLGTLKDKRVVVLDFSEPQKPEWNRLGQKLAADFRGALATAAPNVQQLSTDETEKRLKQYGVSQEDLLIPHVADYIFTHDAPDAWIGGEIVDENPDHILIKFLVHNPDNFRLPYFYLNLELPLTPELSALVGSPVLMQMPNVPVSGTKGYGSPSCEYCPQPGYSREAAKAEVQGAVYMMVAVEPSGAAGDVVVFRKLPFGLTDEAVKAVRRWRFKPAIGPDGEPAEVQQTVEIQFHLY